MSRFHITPDEEGKYYSDGEDYTILESDIFHGESKEDCRKIVRDWYNENVPKALKMALNFLNEE